MPSCVKTSAGKGEGGFFISSYYQCPPASRLRRVKAKAGFLFQVGINALLRQDFGGYALLRQDFFG